ncbi:antitoxin VapB28 [Skermanella aerolata]|uniref:Antitoxin VapB28 n=1 Tax=Skermanella aerolata TaxID=393310 RepID=A0A512DSJ9_9PROT|nr:type II toxin-antitoxin system VapB family antitoxin [Skermanella aerolata]KJB96099.1 antitoxin [Skermanella aerolata KACC 11604]GEO39453.1 antitoxin VapB28 [Skermanella aerolata]
MPLNIKDPNTEQVVHEPAAITGEVGTTAVRNAAEERFQRIRRDEAGRRLADELLAIGACCSALPDLDTRSINDILSYDEHGFPN